MNLPESFWRNVEKGSDCWLWTGKTNEFGYGIYTYRSRKLPAHRAAFLLTRGEITPGLDIDHLCRNRACVRPDHLEAVTRAENIRRMVAARRALNLTVGRAKISIVSIPGPYAGPHEIATMFGVSRQRVTQLTSRADFPEPVAVLKMGKVWLTKDIVEWAQKRGRLVHDLNPLGDAPDKKSRPPSR